MLEKRYSLAVVEVNPFEVDALFLFPDVGLIMEIELCAREIGMFPIVRVLPRFKPSSK